MKFKSIKRLVSGLAAGFICIASVNFAAMRSTTDAANAKVGDTLTLNGAGRFAEENIDGYSYEIWAADTPNKSTMYLGEGGKFNTAWNCTGDKGNFLARRGMRLGSVKHYQDYGNIVCDFDVDFKPSQAGNSRVCVYGWTQEPLVEYYIVEDWANWRPPAGGGNGSGNVIAQVDIDGSTYDIYKEFRKSYTIEGEKEFVQYFSVRHDRRDSGQVSVSEHFKAWEANGLELGNIYEVALNIEGWESTGSATVNKNVVTIGGELPEQTTSAPVEPAEDGSYIKYNFDKEIEGFTGRGSAGVEVDKDNYYEGGGSMFVSGREDNWHGASLSLPSKIFKPGETYSFSAAALQKSGEATELKMTLQYSLSGEENYDEIAHVSAKDGQWIKIENTEYTIPNDATGLTLYFEAPESMTDFYIDNFMAAVKGTESDVETGAGYINGQGSLVPVSGLLRGDFCTDQKINSFDVLAGRIYLVEAQADPKAAPALDVSDVDRDGKFAINDIIALAKFILTESEKY
ncbi:MAG: glycoside hydrolase family 11 protein [Ruminococcus sp.]|nr:glycoside hydrolase family 11 protein [Ruminococcus sp.]